MHSHFKTTGFKGNSHNSIPRYFPETQSMSNFPSIRQLYIVLSNHHALSIRRGDILRVILYWYEEEAPNGRSGLTCNAANDI